MGGVVCFPSCIVYVCDAPLVVRTWLKCSLILFSAGDVLPKGSKFKPIKLIFLVVLGVAANFFEWKIPTSL